MLSRRTKTLIGMTASGVLLFAATAALVAWLLLPRWAPGLVIRYSPFVDPIVRAVAAARPLPEEAPAQVGGWPPPDANGSLIAHADSRLADLATVAVLRRCLGSVDRAVRFHALRLLQMVDPPDPALLRRLARDPEPWVRLAAWDLMAARVGKTSRSQAMSGWLRVTYSMHHAMASASVSSTVPRWQADMIRAVLEVGVDQLRDGDACLRLRVVEVIGDDPGRFMPVRVALLGIVAESEPGFAERLLRAFEPDWFTLGPEGQHVPSDLVFPLLHLAHHPDPDLREAVGGLAWNWLERIAVDYDAWFAELDAMQRGAKPWVPGAEPWMHEQLQPLLERRVTLDLRQAKLADLPVLVPGANLALDPWLLSTEKPGSVVTATFVDQRLIDVLQSLAKATGTRLQLRGGVAYLSDDNDPARADGFVPTPLIDDDEVDVARASDLATWRAALQQRVDADAVGEALEQTLTRICPPVGIPFDRVWASHDDEPRDLHLRQLTLDQVLRFLAVQRRARLTLGTDGIIIR